MRGVFALFGLALAATPTWAEPPAGLSAPAGWPRPGETLAVVVHGINPVHSDLDPLAADLAQRGFRVLRFVYDDGQDLDRSAGELAGELRDLQAFAPKRVAVVAHSMGGLVARRALSDAHDLGEVPQRYRLLTVASPFGGFRGANWARLDLGFGRDSHDDLGTRARFIREPGDLIATADHVKVETDEAGQTLDGASDDAVARASQLQQHVDDQAARRYQLALGHVGSIRTADRQVPAPLRRILDRELGARRGPLPAGIQADPRVDRAAAGEAEPASPEPRRGITHRLGHPGRRR